MTRPLRVGLVGSGSMGALHARVIAPSHADGARLVVDPAEPIGEEVARRYGAVWTAEFDRAVGRRGGRSPRRPSSTTSSRCDAIEAGIPLLVEKPLADDYRRRRGDRSRPALTPASR